MNAKTFGLAGLWAVTAIIAAVAIAKLHQTRALNQQLRAELEAQSAMEVRPRQVSPESDAESGLARDEKLELMRLRNEVTQLRASAAAAREAVKDALENRDRAMERVAMGNAVSQSVIGMELPKEQWSFRGYATPEDAVVTAMWALVNGDLERVAESMPPGDQTEWQDQRARSSDDAMGTRIQREFGDLTALKISGRKEVSPTEMLVDVVMNKPQQISTRQVHVYREGNEWKMQSLFNVYDPMAFYRKNPELMKRYFPHLYQQQQPLASSEGGTLPPEAAPQP